MNAIAQSVANTNIEVHRSHLIDIKFDANIIKNELLIDGHGVRFFPSNDVVYVVFNLGDSKLCKGAR